MPGAVSAGTLDEWLSGIEIEARLGRGYVSNYDVAVNVAFSRMRRGLSLGERPGRKARRRALSRVIHQRVLLDAVERFGLGVPDIRDVQTRGRELVRLYGEGSTESFTRRTGMPYTRMLQEVRDRRRIRGYLKEVLLPGVRVTEAEVQNAYASMATAWALQGSGEGGEEQVRQLLYYQKIEEELRRLVERYRERREIEVYLPGMTLDELLGLWAPGGDSLNPMNLPSPP